MENSYQYARTLIVGSIRFLSQTYPNLLGIKGFVVVIVGCRTQGCQTIQADGHWATMVTFKQLVHGCITVQRLVDLSGLVPTAGWTLGPYK
jgi:hypothetical protein